MRNPLLLVLALVLIVGCQPTPPPTFLKQNLANGRYFLEIEDTGGSSALNFQSHSEGKTVTEEHYHYTWGENRSLKIDDGKLTVDDQSLGELKEGDRIVIHKDGKITVNGEPRSAEK